MDVYEAVLKRRTIRKFKQEPIDREVLIKLVNAARYAPSGANMQPLKYMIVDDPNLNNKVFSTLKWAGYIAPHGDPKKGEEPVAYIIVLADTSIRKDGYELDAGAAVQNILLTAEGENIGSCWLGSINRDDLRKHLGIDENLCINSVLALGYKAEVSVAQDQDGSIKYYKEDGILHVPKRLLEDILIQPK